MLFYILIISLCARSQSLVPPNLSSIRGILGSKMVMSTILNEVNSEVVSENIILYELTNQTHQVEIDIFYGITFMLSFYVQYKYFAYIDKRLSGVKMFSNIQDKTRIILFIFMIVFTKNIQNAI